MAEQGAKGAAPTGESPGARGWCLLVCVLFALPIGYAVFRVLAGSEPHFRPASTCRSHLTQCQMALMLYVEEHGRSFPTVEDGTDWVGCVLPYLVPDEGLRFDVLHCPVTVREREQARRWWRVACRRPPEPPATDYVLNVELCGRALSEVPADTVLLMERRAFDHLGSPLGVAVDGRALSDAEWRQDKP